VSQPILCSPAPVFARASVGCCEGLAKPSHTPGLQAAIECAAGRGSGQGARDRAGARERFSKEAANVISMDSHRKDARDDHPDIDRRFGDGKRRRRAQVTYTLEGSDTLTDVVKASIKATSARLTYNNAGSGKRRRTCVALWREPAGGHRPDVAQLCGVRAFGSHELAADGRQRGCLDAPVVSVKASSSHCRI